MAHDDELQRRNWPQPPGYHTPPFPSLHWPYDNPNWSLYTIADVWRFTLLWTLIVFGLFHVGAAGIALAMRVGWPRSNWKFLWLVPLAYLFAAGVEAVIAGSVVGVIVGVVYVQGRYAVSTWIPFIWGWINVLVLIISSFTIQGGL